MASFKVAHSERRRWVCREVFVVFGVATVIYNKDRKCLLINNMTL